MKFLKRLFNKVVPTCPFEDVTGPYEALEFRDWSREKTMETPRVCLEFLGIRDYVSAKGEELGDKTRWISSDEKERILAHKHTVAVVKVKQH